MKTDLKYLNKDLYYLNLDKDTTSVNFQTLQYNVKHTLSIFGEYLYNAKIMKGAQVFSMDWVKSGKKCDEGFWIQLKRPYGMPGVTAGKSFREFLRSKFIYDRNDSAKIKILLSNHDTNELLVEKLPTYHPIYTMPNTVDLWRQRKAIFSLRDTPHPLHKPLLKLLNEKRFVQWSPVRPLALSERDWYILKPDTDLGKYTRETVSRQRQFVEMALASPDFAILEGPPGTGKTISICEYILQVIKNDGRVLLCASTHVAVDNVLERLRSFEEVIAVRIGSDREKISPGVRDRHILTYRKDETNRLVTFLEAKEELLDSQKYLLNALKSENDDTTSSNSNGFC